MTLDEFEQKLGDHHDWLAKQYNKGVDEIDMHRKLIKLARAVKRAEGTLYTNMFEVDGLVGEVFGDDAHT